MIIYTVSTHFLLQPSQKSASKYIFYEKYEDFSFFDPPKCQETITFSNKKAFQI